MEGRKGKNYYNQSKILTQRQIQGEHITKPLKLLDKESQIETDFQSD